MYIYENYIMIAALLVQQFVKGIMRKHIFMF